MISFELTMACYLSLNCWVESDFEFEFEQSSKWFIKVDCIVD